MADKKISELLESQNITGEELIPFVLDGQNKVVRSKFLKGADNLGNDFVDLLGDDGQKYRVKMVNGQPVATRIDAFLADDHVAGTINPVDTLELLEALELVELLQPANKSPIANVEINIFFIYILSFINYKMPMLR